VIGERDFNQPVTVALWLLALRSLSNGGEQRAEAVWVGRLELAFLPAQVWLAVADLAAVRVAGGSRERRLHKRTPKVSVIFSISKSHGEVFPSSMLLMVWRDIPQRSARRDCESPLFSV
jgi:hypothetical protein